MDHAWTFACCEVCGCVREDLPENLRRTGWTTTRCDRHSEAHRQQDRKE